MNPLAGKKLTTISVATVIAVLTGIAQIQVVHEYLSGFLGNHTQVAAAIAGIGAIIALFHQPNQGQ